MKEQEPGRLTNQAPNPRLELGRNFMQEPGSTEGERPTVEGATKRIEEAAKRGEAGYERLIREAAREVEAPIPGEAALDLDELRRSGRLSAEAREVLIIGDIERTRDPEERKQKIKDHLREISPHQQQSPRLLELATEFDETLDYLVNRIVAQPLDAETSDYRLSFYGGINLEFIKDILKTKAERDSRENRRYHRILGVIEAASLFHEMNKLIVMGQLDGFVRAAAAITPGQLETLQEVKGVAQVMRLFDEEYNRFLAKDNYIKNRGNYDQMMGIQRDEETGEIKLVEGGSIEDQLKKLVEAESELSLDLGGSLKGLEKWQIRWAFQAGKLLTNMSLRAGELISLGKLKPGDEQYASFPQESAAKLMNWMGLSGLRFSISEVRGGVKLAEMTRENYQKLRKKQGYGEINITKIGGKDIKDFEDAGMFGVSGIWSSWRQNLILLKNAPIAFASFPNTLREYISSARKAYEREGEAKALEKTFLDSDGSLRSEINAYLGVLLKHGSINPTETDSKEVVEIKHKIRTEIWRRAAQDNPLGIAPFLIGVEGKLPEEVVNLTDILRQEGGVWDSLRAKLRIAHERRLAAINRREEDTSLDRFIRENGEKSKELRLTEKEDNLLKDIRSNGKLLATEFAKIRLPFNPFMNDVIFERAEYGDAGAEFFRRRTGGDLPSFYKSYEEFVKLMDNPGVQSLEKITEVLHSMVQAIGVPLSTGTGQDKVAPFAEAMLTFIMRGGHIEKIPGLKIGPLELKPPLGLIRWVAKDGVTNFIKNRTNHPNSLAQAFSGEEALSLGESELKKAIDTWLHAGIFRKGLKKDGKLVATDLYDEFLKKFNVKFGGLLLAFLRAFLPVFIIGTLVETGKRTYSGK